MCGHAFLRLCLPKTPSDAPNPHESGITRSILAHAKSSVKMAKCPGSLTFLHSSTRWLLIGLGSHSKTTPRHLRRSKTDSAQSSPHHTLADSITATAALRSACQRAGSFELRVRASCCTRPDRFWYHGPQRRPGRIRTPRIRFPGGTTALARIQFGIEHGDDAVTCSYSGLEQRIPLIEATAADRLVTLLFSLLV